MPTAALIGRSCKDLDDDFSIRCEGYSKACSEDAISAQKQQVKFEGKLISIPDEHSATRYSTSVCPWNVKMLNALGEIGVKSLNDKSCAFSPKDKKLVCNRALEYLLKQTEECRAKYALEFEGLLAEELNPRFMTLKSLVDNELCATADA